MTFYSSLSRNILFPAYYGLSGRLYASKRAFLEKSQWWSSDQIREFQWNELVLLVRHAYKNVPRYRQKYSDVGFQPGDLRSWSDFARLPQLSRDEIRQYRHELCAAGMKGQLLPHATGGSTGTPTRFYITLDSYDWRTATTDRVYSWTGTELGEKTLFLWGSPVGHQSRLQALKKSFYDSVRREVIEPTFHQSEEGWQKVHRRLKSYRPARIVGYVSSLEEFARFLTRKNKSLPPLHAIISAAEPLPSASRDLIQGALGAPVFNTYGCREFISLGGECEKHDGHHLNSENVLVEMSSQSTIDPSNLLITDLHNYGMPFIRYKIGDVGLLSDSPCDCGRGLPRLSRIDGRQLDILKLADGRVVPGEFFPHLLKEIEEIIKFQVEQTAPDKIVIRLVLERPLGIDSRDLISREVLKVFGPDTFIDIQEVEEIPLLASGKRRVTIRSWS